MKYFLDTEFIEYPNTIDLISIGIISEDNRKLYLISNEFLASKADKWVVDNVISKLGNEERYTIAEIKQKILNFIGDDKPEFWGYYADYDWVVFCWIFGRMIDLPKGWPMFCRDIKQLCDQMGNPKLPEQKTQEHNALADAEWNKLAYNHLKTIGSKKNE